MTAFHTLSYKDKEMFLRSAVLRIFSNIISVRSKRQNGRVEKGAL